MRRASQTGQNSQSLERKRSRARRMRSRFAAENVAFWASGDEVGVNEIACCRRRPAQSQGGGRSSAPSLSPVPHRAHSPDHLPAYPSHHGLLNAPRTSNNKAHPPLPKNLAIKECVAAGKPPPPLPRSPRRLSSPRGADSHLPLLLPRPLQSKVFPPSTHTHQTNMNLAVEQPPCPTPTPEPCP